MKLRWPFKLSFSVGFSVGYDDSYSTRSPAEQALDMAVNVRSADTPSLLDSIQRAESYLKFMEEHK